MGVTSTRAPARGGNRLGKKKILAKFRMDPVLVTVPFLEPGQSFHLVFLDGPVLATMETSPLNR